MQWQIQDLPKRAIVASARIAIREPKRGSGPSGGIALASIGPRGRAPGGNLKLKLFVHFHAKSGQKLRIIKMKTCPRV